MMMISEERRERARRVMKAVLDSIPGPLGDDLIMFAPEIGAVTVSDREYTIEALIRIGDIERDSEAHKMLATRVDHSVWVIIDWHDCFDVVLATACGPGTPVYEA